MGTGSEETLHPFPGHQLLLPGRTLRPTFHAGIGGGVRSRLGTARRAHVHYTRKPTNEPRNSGQPSKRLFPLPTCQPGRYAVPMPVKRYNTGAAFIEALEKSQDEGNFEHIEANISQLVKLVARLQDQTFELIQLQQRARELLERHG